LATCRADDEAGFAAARAGHAALPRSDGDRRCRDRRFRPACAADELGDDIAVIPDRLSLRPLARVPLAPAAREPDQRRERGARCRMP
jgi:hypothetical protein